MDHRFGLRIGIAIMTAVVAVTVGPEVSRFLNRQATLSEMSSREGVEQWLGGLYETEPALATMKRCFPRDHAAMVTDIQKSALARDDDGITDAIVSYLKTIVRRDDHYLANSPLPNLLRVAEAQQHGVESLSVARCAALVRGKPIGKRSPNDQLLARRWEDAQLQAMAAGRDTPAHARQADAKAIHDFQIALRNERVSDDAWRIIFKLRSQAESSDAAVCEAQRMMLRALRAMPASSAEPVASRILG